MSRTILLVRIIPYYTVDKMIDGVVMTFVDITSEMRMRIAEEALDFAQNIIDSVHHPLIVLDESLKVASVNKAFYREFQITQDQTIGIPIYELGNQQWDIPILRELLTKVSQENRSFENYIMEHNFLDIGHRKLNLNARRIINKVEEPSLILLSMEIIHEKPLSEI